MGRSLEGQGQGLGELSMACGRGINPGRGNAHWSLLLGQRQKSENGEDSVETGAGPGVDR